LFAFISPFIPSVIYALIGESTINCSQRRKKCNKQTYSEQKVKHNSWMAMNVMIAEVMMMMIIIMIMMMVVVVIRGMYVFLSS
jgi:hypothetical protein